MLAYLMSSKKNMYVLCVLHVSVRPISHLKDLYYPIAWLASIIIIINIIYAPPSASLQNIKGHPIDTIDLMCSPPEIYRTESIKL